MNKKELRILVKKYLAGHATDPEKIFIETYYTEFDSNSTISDAIGNDDNGQIEHEMFVNILDRISKSSSRAAVKDIRWKRYAAVAAILAMVVSVGLLIANKQSPTFGDLSAYKTYYTTPGNLLKIFLNDGTVVWLNAGSKLKAPENFEGSPTREVYLEGEGYFEVAKDKKHPFLVHTRNLTTQVLGTKFDVNAYITNTTIEVTLLEGKVMLTTALSKAKKRKIDTLFLKPNEKAYFNEGTSIIKKPSNNSGLNSNQIKLAHGTTISSSELSDTPLRKIEVENSPMSASWKDGRLAFDNELLSNVLQALSRKYNVSISANENLLNVPITLNMGNEQVEDVLLEITKQLKHHSSNGNNHYDGDGQFKKVGSKYFIE